MEVEALATKAVVHVEALATVAVMEAEALATVALTGGLELQISFFSTTVTISRDSSLQLFVAQHTVDLLSQGILVLKLPGLRCRTECLIGKTAPQKER